MSARSTTSSAALDGVAARTSATKSAIVKSTSCPTAEITGTGHAAIARATRFAVERLQILGRSAAASDDHDVDLRHPHDRAQRAHEIDRRVVALHPRGANDHAGRRMPRVRTRRMSRTAAPSSEVTMPMRRGSTGSGRLRAVSNRPSGLQLALELLERGLERAEPLWLHRVDDDLILALHLVDAEAAARETCMPSSGRNLSCWAVMRNITARTCA